MERFVFLLLCALTVRSEATNIHRAKGTTTDLIKLKRRSLSEHLLGDAEVEKFQDDKNTNDHSKDDKNTNGHNKIVRELTNEITRAFMKKLYENFKGQEAGSSTDYHSSLRPSGVWRRRKVRPPGLWSGDAEQGRYFADIGSIRNMVDNTGTFRSKKRYIVDNAQSGRHEIPGVWGKDAAEKVARDNREIPGVLGRDAAVNEFPRRMKVVGVWGRSKADATPTSRTPEGLWGRGVSNNELSRRKPRNIINLI